MSFNLFSRPFVNARLLSGEDRLFDLLGLLRNSSEIRCISIASPLDEFAIHRLLIAIVHQVRTAKLSDALEMDEDFLNLVCENEALFDLFDPKRPFFQDPTAADEERRPASDLFAELPSDTSINHFQHIYDANIVLCPVCCAFGALRIPPFCTQGGQGKAPSLNAAPPAYVLPYGDTLRETLLMNLRALPIVNGDRPCWSGTSSSEHLGPLEGLTWQARRVLLFPEPAEGRRCSRCGGIEEALEPRIVQRIIFAKGRPLADAVGRNWRDPHSAHLDGDVIRPPEPIADPLGATTHGLKVARSLLRSLIPEDDDSGVDAVRCAAQAADERPIRLSSVSFATRQAKPLDDFATTWVIATTLLCDVDTVGRLLGELDWYETTVRDFQKQVYVHLRRKRPASSGDSLQAPSRLCQLHCHRKAVSEFRKLIAKPDEIDNWRKEISQSVREGFHDWLVPLAPILQQIECKQHFESEIARLLGTANLVANRLPVRQIPEIESARNFIARLDRLRQDDRDRLKRLATRPLEDDARTFDIIADLWWPEHARLKPRLAVFAVAILYPWYPQQTLTARGRDFGRSLGILCRKYPTRTSRVRRQLETLLSLPLSSVAEFMLPVVQELARAKISLDWANVLSDLRKWDRKEHKVQFQWAQSFHSEAQHAH